MAYSSWFRYNVTRAYPFRWFTPVVITGLTIFTILLSFLNFVTTGYTLLNQEASNPNATVISGVWKKNWPSWITRSVKPRCESINIPIGHSIFTNQTALPYTLTDIWQTRPDNEYSYIPDSVSPFLTYHNNVIENCTVNSVELDYAAMDRSANQFAFSAWGVVVRTYATCSISNKHGTTMFNLTQQYDYVPEEISFAQLYEYLGTNFLSTNKTSSASLYWGESLMSMYWAYSSTQMQYIASNQTANDLPAIRKGILFFYPNQAQAPKDITTDSFFSIDFRFVVDEGRGNYTVISPNTYGQYEYYTSISTLMEQSVYPNIWSSASILAKAAYSTVLTDLGQTNVSYNILANATLLRSFTSSFTETRRNISNAYPGPTEFPYGTISTGNLSVTPSVFSAKYQCEVPRRKPAGDIFVSVLVADLVFLQALWFLWTKGVALFLLRKRSTAQCCEGCIAQMNAAALVQGRSTEPKAGPAEEMEMDGLRASGKSRDMGPYERISISEERLIDEPHHSMDIGYRHLT